MKIGSGVEAAQRSNGRLSFKLNFFLTLPIFNRLVDFNGFCKKGCWSVSCCAHGNLKLKIIPRKV